MTTVDKAWKHAALVSALHESADRIANLEADRAADKARIAELERVNAELTDLAFSGVDPDTGAPRSWKDMCREEIGMRRHTAAADKAEIERLREALRPFAEQASLPAMERFGPSATIDLSIGSHFNPPGPLSVGEFRRAREALEPRS